MELLIVSVAFGLHRGLEKMVSRAEQCCPACASFNRVIEGLFYASNFRYLPSKNWRF
jgi:hypothetical protein